MKKSKKNIVISSISLLLGMILFILKYWVQNNRYFETLSYIGIGIFYASFLYLIPIILPSNAAIQKFEEKKQIQTTDERAIRIREKAGYTCYKITFYFIGLVMFISSFRQNDTLALSFSIYLCIYSILYLAVKYYYSKRM